MKAAIYQGIHNIEIKDLPMPECDDDGIVIKNIYASICGSDVTAYNHGGQDNMIYEGYEFGHEMVGRVVRVGKNVQGIKEGDRVFPVPAYAKGTSHRAATVGGFSEYVELPKCTLNKSVYLVSDKIEDKLASIIEPFTVGCNAAQKLNPEKGKKAIVFGAGAIGLTAAMTLKYLGCDVVVVDIIEKRLEIARSLGMKICNTSTQDYLDTCCELLGQGMNLAGKAIDADYYVDAAGNQAIMDMFFKGAKFFSKISVVAVYHQPVELNFLPLTYQGLQIIGPAGGLDGSDVRLVMEILESHQFPVENIITHEYKHENIIEAFDKASKSDEALKVVIKYDE